MKLKYKKGSFHQNKKSVITIKILSEQLKFQSVPQSFYLKLQNLNFWVNYS